MRELPSQKALEVFVKSIPLLFLLFYAAFSVAQQTDDYRVSVHVSASRWAMEPSLMSSHPVQRLDVVINGKKYELAAPATLRANFEAGVTLLMPGDYKARLVRDLHKTTYESSQEYEFLLPDKKTRKFTVVGISE